MTDVWVLYRQSAPGVASTPPLVLGVFSSAAAAQHAIRPVGSPDQQWRAPRPGRWRWELEKDGYLYIVEQHPVRASGGIVHALPANQDAPEEAVDKRVDDLDRLESHVSELIQETASAARECHASWTARAAGHDDEQAQRQRQNERFYLGQAMALAWVAHRLARLREPPLEQSDRLLQEQYRPVEQPEIDATDLH